MSIIDPSLQTMARNVERDQEELPVILQVDGFLVAGKLISVREFWSINLSSSESASQDLKTERKRLLDEQVSWLAPLQLKNPEVLLLKNVLLAGGKRTVKTHLWRTRIDAVSGWCVGSLPDDV